MQTERVKFSEHFFVLFLEFFYLDFFYYAFLNFIFRLLFVTGFKYYSVRLSVQFLKLFLVTKPQIVWV